MAGANASQQQIIDILLRSNPNAAADLRREIQLLESQMSSFAANAARSGASTSAVADQLVRAQQHADRMRGTLAALEGNLTSTGRQSGAAARGILELSRGLEDLSTGGFIGILNNIPGMVSSVGQAAGLAGPQVAALTAVISIGATAAYTASKNWHGLANALGLGTIETAKEEMDRLGKSTSRTADETDRLLGLQRQAATMKAQEAARTADEKSQSDIVGAAVGGVKYDDLVKGLSQSAGGELARTDKTARAAQDALDERANELKATAIPGAHGGTRDRTPEEYRAALANDPAIRSLRTKLEAELKEAAKRLLADAQNDPNRLKALVNIVGRSPGSFPVGFGESLAEATPEGRAATAAFAEPSPTEQGNLEWEASKPRREAAERERKKIEHDRKTADEHAARRLAAGFRHRLGEVASDDVATADRKAGRIGAIGRDVDASTLRGEILEDTRQAVRDALAAAQREGRRDDRQAASKVEHDRKAAQSKLKAEAGRVDDAYQDRLVYAMVTNRLANAQGGGLDPRVQRQVLTREVAQELRQSGRDPALAPQIVENAAQDVSGKFDRAMALTNGNVDMSVRQQTAMLAVLEGVLVHNQELRQRVMENEVRLFGLRNHAQRGGNVGPSFQNPFGGVQ